MTDWSPALKAAGLKVTAGRVAVLSTLEERKHLGIPELVEATRARVGAVSLQAIYDIVAALQGANLIRRIEPAGQPPRFELQTGDNHHHLMCRSCGLIRDVACSVGQAPCLEPAAALGFSIEEAEVIYWGLCSDCNERKS